VEPGGARKSREKREGAKRDLRPRLLVNTISGGKGSSPGNMNGLEFPRNKRSQKVTEGDRRCHEVTGGGARRIQEEPERTRRW
jgi:hypothetical protein